MSSSFAFGSVDRSGCTRVEMASLCQGNTFAVVLSKTKL